MSRSWSTAEGDATRQQILDLLREHPGLHKSEIARRTGISWGNVGHHLERLQQERLLRPFREGRRVHWFPPDLSARHHYGLSILNNDYVGEAIQSLRHQPGLTLHGLAEQLDISQKVASRVLRQLEEAGYVRHQGPDRIFIQEDRLPS